MVIAEQSRNMEISKYSVEYEEALLSALREDANWKMFTSGETIDTYRSLLRDSITYICHEAYEFCGYVRAIQDSQFGIYISELYVVPDYRNKGIGRSLLEKIKNDYADIVVYALSDEDPYYEKLGYRKVGSVFQLD